QRGAASGGEHVGEQLGFGGLAGGHARGQGAHRGGGGVLGGVLEHRQAALVVAQHQAQEQGVELGGGGAAQGVEFGGGGHAGHGGHRAGVLVRTPVVTAVAVAVAHPAHVPLHRLRGRVPQLQPALHAADLVRLGGEAVVGQAADLGVGGAGERDARHLHRLVVVGGHVLQEADVHGGRVGLAAAVQRQPQRAADHHAEQDRGHRAEHQHGGTGPARTPGRVAVVVAVVGVVAGVVVGGVVLGGRGDRRIGGVAH